MSQETLSAVDILARESARDSATTTEIMRDELQALALRVRDSIRLKISEAVTRSRSASRALESEEVALVVARAISSDLEPALKMGRRFTDEDIDAAARVAIDAVVRNFPRGLTREDWVGLGLFLGGLTVSGAGNLWLMNLVDPASSLGTKLVVQNLSGTAMGLLMRLFKPYFERKVSAKGRAINYRALDWLKERMGAVRIKGDGAPPIPAHKDLLGELEQLIIRHGSVEARIQGVLGLMIGFTDFIGGSFFKARYMLDDSNNEHRIEDAVDLIAGILVTSRFIYYAVKPEFRQLFESYVFMTLRPLLGEHAKRDGERILSATLERIRRADPPPSSESIERYFEPFLRGALGLADQETTTSVSEILRRRLEAERVSGDTGKHDVSHAPAGQRAPDSPSPIKATIASGPIEFGLGLASGLVPSELGAYYGFESSTPISTRWEQELMASPGKKPRLEDLADEIVRTVDAAFTQRARGLFGPSRKLALHFARARAHVIAQVGVRIDAKLRDGCSITRADFMQAVEGAVDAAAADAPGLASPQNLAAGSLFAAGLGVSVGANATLMSILSAAGFGDGTVLGVQSIFGAAMGFLLGLFNPAFDDKWGSHADAVNSRLLNAISSLAGRREPQPPAAKVPLDPSTQALLENVYVAQQALDGRLQGVLGLLMGFCAFIGESSFRARYILDASTSNADARTTAKSTRTREPPSDSALLDACDLLAGVLVTARVNFYAVRPELSHLFQSYVYSVLRPTLRKYTRDSETAERMFTQVLERIRAQSGATQAEIDAYYAPFLRNTLGLEDPVASTESLFGALERILVSESVTRSP